MAGPYRTFLLDLADHLMKDNVEKMKFLLTDVIPGKIRFYFHFCFVAV